MSDAEQPPGQRDPSPDADVPARDDGVGFAAITDPPGPPDSQLGPAATPDSMPPVAPPPKKSPIALIGVFIAVVAAAAGAIFIKFILPLVLVGVAGEVLDTAFGGPYTRLPGDVRAGFEERLKTALGDSLNDKSDAEQTAAILAQVKAGLSRLDDGLVDTNFRLTSKAIGAVDVANCAAVSRAIVGGAEPPGAAATAMIDTLTDAELKQWFEIRVSAIEAEVRGSPAQVVIGDEAVSPLYDKLFLVMDAGNIETIGQIATGQTVEDEPLCTAVRDLYVSVLTLSAEDVVLFARYDVSP
jgi:hypothetical protein